MANRKTAALLALTLALAAASAVYLIVRRQGGDVTGAPAHSHGRYQCAMHPQIVSDKPGKCPICGMNLQKVEDGAAPDRAAGGKPLFYRHPMRPDVTSPTPSKDEMGMDYVPVYAEEAAGAAVVDGHASFSLSPDRQQLIGVKTSTVSVRTLEIEIRAAGRVAYDPELYAAIEEYKQAAAANVKIKDSPLADARRGAQALVRAAATRLRQLGLSQDMIEKLAGEESDPLNLLLPGKTAWIYAEVYEHEVDLLKPGQEFNVSVPSLPGRVYRGTVAAVDPMIEPATRTARVRGLIETPDRELRPETFVSVTLRVGLGRRLAVPEDAVLDTGERQLVFVKKGAGEFEPRAVKVGRQAKGFSEILSGLEAGEEVVTAANFLIDSESRFRAALSAFGGKP